MTGRYDKMFARSRKDNEGVLGTFVMLGDPSLERSSGILDALVEGGADMLELGIPFSDPVADGPVIQAAAKRALDEGVRTQDCLDLIADLRTRHPDVPIGILTYANIVAARGRERFAHDLAATGADSLLVADVPSIEAQPYAEACLAAGLAPILIAAPNSSRESLATIVELSHGYTYCVTRPGVTGDLGDLRFDHSNLFDRLASLGSAPPVLGFGISRPEHVRSALKSGAMGAISGTAIVAAAEQGGPDAVRQLVRKLKQATRARHSTHA